MELFPSEEYEEFPMCISWKGCGVVQYLDINIVWNIKISSKFISGKILHNRNWNAVMLFEDEPF